MKHNDCANFLNLDCEKGMCALTKTIVPSTAKAATPVPISRKAFTAPTAQTSPNRTNTASAPAPALKRRTGLMRRTAPSAASIICKNKKVEREATQWMI